MFAKPRQPAWVDIEPCPANAYIGRTEWEGHIKISPAQPDSTGAVHDIAHRDFPHAGRRQEQRSPRRPFESTRSRAGKTNDIMDVAGPQETATSRERVGLGSRGQESSRCITRGIIEVDFFDEADGELVVGEVDVVGGVHAGLAVFAKPPEGEGAEDSKR